MARPTTATSNAEACRVQVEPLGASFGAPAGVSLRQAASDAGIQLPSACRNGTCRSCLCRLRAGEVRYRIEWPGLSREEKADGWILPCVAEAASDLIIDAPAAQHVGVTR